MDEDEQKGVYSRGVVYIGKFIELLGDLFVRAFVSPWKIAQSLAVSNSATSNAHRPKRKRSIVRLIGTYLPLPSAPRVYLNLAAWNSCAHSYTSTSTTQDQCSEQDELDKSNEGSSQFDGCDTQAAIKSLQEELIELRLQIAAILENQSNSVKEVVRDVSVLTDSEDDMRPCDRSVPPPPPPMPPTPPPPPPPPLPPAASTPVNGLQMMKKKEPKYIGFSTTTTPSAIHILGQVLTEMKNGRPKLRPVQRSPGGRPLKPVRSPKADPSDVLTEVLRRRFLVAQMSDTNESDASSHTEFASSPDWKSCVT